MRPGFDLNMNKTPRHAEGLLARPRGQIGRTLRFAIGTKCQRLKVSLKS
jgi:hypothetical protein